MWMSGDNSEQRNRISIGLLICFLVLFTLGITVQLRERQGKENSQEILSAMQTIQQLPVECTLEDAINAGYYYEKQPSKESIIAKQEFIRHAGQQGTNEFRKVMLVNQKICLTHIYAQPEEITVLQVLKDSKEGKIDVKKKTYRYLVVCQNLESSRVSFYLTNKEEDMEKSKCGQLSRQQLQNTEAYYLFSNDLSTY